MESDPIWPQTKRKERCWWFQITSIFAQNFLPKRRFDTSLLGWRIFFQWVAHPTNLQHWESRDRKGEKRQTPFSSASFVQIFHTASVFWKQLIIIHKCVESIHSFNFSKSKKRKFEIQRTLVLWNIGIFWVFFGFLDVFTELHVPLGSWTTTENPLVRDEVTGDDGDDSAFVEVTESWKVSSQRKASWTCWV